MNEKFYIYQENYVWLVGFKKDCSVDIASGIAEKSDGIIISQKNVYHFVDTVYAGKKLKSTYINDKPVKPVIVTKIM